MTEIADPKILCLLTYSRAGSYLFHSLLDGHPEIMCFPRTLAFDKFWRSTSGKKEDAGYMADMFIKSHPHFFSGKKWLKCDRMEELGPGRNETFYVDPDSFKKNVIVELGGKAITRKNLFVAFHRVYHSACGNRFNENGVILNHVHYLDYLGEIGAALSDFPGRVYCLVMTRHPVENMKSSVRAMKWRDAIFCGELFNRHKQMLRGVSHINKKFPELDTRYLPFEHLHRYHRQVMESFVKWIGIEWSDSLMFSTKHGKLWWGNGERTHNGTNPKDRMLPPVKSSGKERLGHTADHYL